MNLYTSEIISHKPKDDTFNILGSLDYPQNGDISSQELIVCGWLYKDTLQDADFFIKSDDTYLKLELTILREDVNLFLQKNGVINKDKTGFSLKLYPNKNYKILLKSKCQEILIYSINQTRDLDSEILIKEQWLNFISNKSFKPHPLNNKIININNLEKDLLKNSFKRIDDLSNNLLSFNFLLKEFIKKFQKDTTSQKFLSQAILFNQITIYIDHLNVLAKCSENRLVDGINILKFHYNKNKTFFIFQHVTNCDAIYFTEHNIIININDHIDHDHIKSLIIGYFLKSINSVKKNNSNKFGGVLVSHFRPFHFFHDCMTSCEQAHSQNLLRLVPKFFQIKGSDFIHVENFYFNTFIKSIIDDENFINEYLDVNEIFIIKLGVEYKNSKHKNVHDNLNLRLLDYSKNNGTLKLNERISKCFPIIWIGITGQKRFWKEQVDSQVILINTLQKIYPKLGVIFDGWTSPLNKSPVDQKEIENDMAVVNRFLPNINQNIQYLISVGYTSIDKLFLAPKCNFFIANQGSGSLFICQIAKVKGVTHTSKAFENATLNQDLETAIKFPIDKITDLPDPIFPRADFINYSISPNEFLKFSLPHALKEIDEIKNL